MTARKPLARYGAMESALRERLAPSLLHHQVGHNRRFLQFAGLFAGWRARGARFLARFSRDEEGAWLITMGLVMPVLIGVAGLGTEGGLLFLQHRSLQSAADAAAYSAAISYSYSTSADITTQAKSVVASYGYTLGSGTDQASVTATATTVTTTSSKSLSAVQVTISRPESAIFSSRYFPTVANTVTATAVLDSADSGNCVLTLGNTTTGNNAPDAFYGQGNPSVSVPGCGVFSNSTSATSIALGGSASLTAGAVGSAGSISGGSAITFENSSGTSNNGTYTTNDLPISDPYAGVAIPTTSSAGSCVPNSNLLCPGVYPSGISLKGGTTTLSAGIYILEGEFKVGPGGGGTTVTGTGVTLVFTSATPGTPSSYPSTMLDFDSNATVTLSAPTTGATAGFVMMGDSTMPLDTVFQTHSNPSVTLTGTVYVPRGAFTWNGTPTTGSGACLQYIVNKLTLQGNSGMSNVGCSLSNGQKPIGSIVTLVD